MNIKAKIALLAIITLGIGVAFGSLCYRIFTQERIKRILDRRTPVNFVVDFEKIIEPDESQRELVRNILNKYANHIADLRSKHQKELKTAFESMTAELDSILTPEQKRRIEERRSPGPPPFFGGPPGFADVDEEVSALRERLGLSEDQALKIKKVVEESRSQFEAMHRERMEQMRKTMEGLWQDIELETKKDEAIEKILNEDQKKLYREYKKEREKEIRAKMPPPPRKEKPKDFPRF